MPRARDRGNCLHQNWAPNMADAPVDPKARADELGKQLHGILYLAFLAGRDSVSGHAGDREKYLQAAGAGMVRCVEDAGKLHAAYLEWARELLKDKGAKK